MWFEFGSKICYTFIIILAICATLTDEEVMPEKDSLLPTDDKCQRFNGANEVNFEFYSPLYPNKYPNNTECILTLSADYGHLIRVDFRDFFDMEPIEPPTSTECENDYLEIRDGLYGYSELMGCYCGDDFPPVITSKDRHLWLRFHSDESLQYKGFRAVYKFIENNAVTRPDIGFCLFEKDGTQGIISSEDIPTYRLNYSINYSVPIDCTWKITVLPHERIYLFFENFKLKEPNECETNYVDIFGSVRDLRIRKEHFCGSVADTVLILENIMHFRFFALKQSFDSEFKAWFTAYRDNDADGTKKCFSNEYDCDDATCINSSLRCNKIKNCRNEYDEDGCQVDLKSTFDSEHIIGILTLGCALLAGMCFAMCYNCTKKLVKDGKQIHENIRRSREQLEERRSASLGPSNQVIRDLMLEDEEAYIENKSNGQMCIHLSGDEDTEEDDDGDDEEVEDEDIEDEDSCIEMRDCECQTRDSALMPRNMGNYGTPPPPPPPTRRPPDIPLPHSPSSDVPTPPPPPMSHSPYYTHRPPPSDQYYPKYHDQNIIQTQSDHYTTDDSGPDPSRPRKHRSEAQVLMKDRSDYEPTRSSKKSTPDVLHIH